jgi:hypothetical protein
MKPNAIKRIGLVKRRKDLSYEEFVNHWLHTHAELCKKLPNMRRYSVNLIDRSQVEAFGYDIINLIACCEKDKIKECLENKKEFLCHPSVSQVFNKVNEIIK